jgi:hypothetical protein
VAYRIQYPNEKDEWETTPRTWDDLAEAVKEAKAGSRVQTKVIEDDGRDHFPWGATVWERSQEKPEGEYVHKEGRTDRR